MFRRLPPRRSRLLVRNRSRRSSSRSPTAVSAFPRKSCLASSSVFHRVSCNGPRAPTRGPDSAGARTRVIALHGGRIDVETCRCRARPFRIRAPPGLRPSSACAVSHSHTARVSADLRSRCRSNRLVTRSSVSPGSATISTERSASSRRFVLRRATRRLALLASLFVAALRTDHSQRRLAALEMWRERSRHRGERRDDPAARGPRLVRRFGPSRARVCRWILVSARA